MSIKRLHDDNLTLRTINQSTVIMTESLSITDDGFHERILFLDPAGFTRTIVPLGTFRAGYTVVIFNQASSNNIIFDPNSLAYTVRESKVYGPGAFTYNGSSWECRSPSRVFLSEFSGDLDDIDDGTTWGRVRLTYIDAGKITLALAEGSIDDIENGSTWSSVLSTELSAGMIKLTDHSVTEFSDTGLLATMSNIGILNYISNGDFTMLNASTTEPDGWSLSGTGATSARSTTQKKFGSYSCIMTNGVGNPCELYQYLHYQYGINYFYGKTISLSMWVWASAGSRVRVAIAHNGYGGGAFWSGYHSGNSSWEQLTVIGHTCSSDMTALWVSCYIDAGAATSVYIDGAMCVDGNVIPSNWVPRGVASPTGSGAIITANYFALMVGSIPRFIVTSSGSLGLQTSSGNYGFYYYGTAGGGYGEGDLRIGSSTDYILWDQSAGKFLINTLGSLTIQGGGQLVIKGVGSFNDTNYPLIFSGTVHSFTMQADGTTDYVSMLPNSNAHQYMYIGYTGKTWYSISEYASIINLVSTGTTLMLGSSAYLTGTLIPYAAGLHVTANCGDANFHFNYIYASNALVVGDLMVMDTFDDLDALMNIKPLMDKDGKEAVDPYRGVALVDDSTLPSYILGVYNDTVPDEEILLPDGKTPHGRVSCGRIKGHKEGDTPRNLDGKLFYDTTAMLSWLMGCIKQLNIKVEDLIKKVGEIKPVDDIKP